MLDLMEESVVDRKMTPEEKTALKLNIGRIPEIILDNTDRNRTSPFAFTGNRFEFRAVGSSANCASAMIALNTAIADQLTQFKIDVDVLIEAGVKKDEAIFQVLKKLIIESKAIRFDGNGYSDEWKVEAAKRGLTNITSVPTALEALHDKRVVEMYGRMHVLTEREIEGRIEVELEKYTKKIQIEARVLGDLAINHIVPTAIEYQTMLLENVKNMKLVFSDAEFKSLAEGRIELIREIGGHVSSIKAKVRDMVEGRKVANLIESEKEKAYAYEKSIRPYLDDIRYHIDKLELIVDNELWPLPKYRELLFVR